LNDTFNAAVYAKAMVAFWYVTYQKYALTALSTLWYTHLIGHPKNVEQPLAVSLTIPSGHHQLKWRIYYMDRSQ